MLREYNATGGGAAPAAVVNLPPRIDIAGSKLQKGEN
jgi:hypothetical protein